MRFIAFALLAIAATTAEGQKKICEPGTHTKVDCNNCICIKDGTAYACTMMLCADENPSEVRIRSPALKKLVCEPGEARNDDCNTCRCLGDGSDYACTLKDCSPGKDPSRSAPGESKEVCKPGQTKKERCNHCFCSGDGSEWACTRMACPEHSDEDGSPKLPHKIPEDSDAKNCEPGKAFKKYCNTCVCGVDGKRVACTKLFCPPGIFNEDGSLKRPNGHAPLWIRKPESNVNCVPGTVYRYYFDHCVFAGQNTLFPCIRLYCSPGSYDENGSPNVPTLGGNSENKIAAGNVCTPDEVFRSDCNTCICSADGTSAMCTRMLCERKNIVGRERSIRQKEQRVCEPGKVFTNECNKCVCNEDGSSAACTIMFCIPKPLRVAASSEVVLEAPRVCEPGKSFEKDCNHCLCSEDGTAAFCILKHCTDRVEDRQKRSVGIAEPSDRFCHPGKVFERDCSICVCGLDGASAHCTVGKCFAKVAKVEGSTRRFCEPGERYEQDCNSCVCNKDGNGAACTLKLCLPEFV